MSSIGDSIVCVADDEIVKIHVHTNDPGLAIQKALTYGQLSRMKIDNMREEHREKLIRDSEKLAKEQAEAEEAKKTAEPKKPMGFIAVSIGDGMNEIFRELGADYIIEGGQTMNPSTDDMLKAIDQVNAETIFILPNNKNIILAANQAKDLVEDTYAVRDTHIDDKEIHQGDIMGIGDAGILSVGQDIAETTLEMLEQLVDDDSELISLYYGQDVTEEEADAFTQEVEKLYPDIDVDVHCGGQPIYYYVLAVE